MKTKPYLIVGLVVACLALMSWRATVTIFGETAPEVTYTSPVGSFKLPTVDATAGAVGRDYQLATMRFYTLLPPGTDDTNGNRGNGFSDRYFYENIDAPCALLSTTECFEEAANQVGHLDSLDPRNVMIGPGGRPINPGFRFVHPGRMPYVWRIGSSDTDSQLAQQVIIFPSLDHLFTPETQYGPNAANPPADGLGNVVLEATEFTVWGTKDAAEAQRAATTDAFFGTGGTGVLPSNGKWVRATLVKVFAEGFSDYNGLSPFANRAAGTAPSPQEGDDFASFWEFRDSVGNPVPVKFVAVYSNGTRDARFFIPDANGKIPGNGAQSLDAEIDAVGYIPFVAPALGSIAGRVLNDVNGNGAIDPGDTPLQGVTVHLFNSTGTTELALTTTNATGGYSFTGLAAGSYRVVETNLPNYIDTGVIPGTGNTAIDANTIAVNLAAAQNSVENNFLDGLLPSTCVPACYLDADMWDIDRGARLAAYQKAGGVGNIFILTLNRGAMNDAEVVAALEGFDGGKGSLDREYVTAELNTVSYPGSIFNRASCFFNGPNAAVKLTGNPRLLDVMLQAKIVFATGTLAQIRLVTFQLALFNNLTATTGIVCKFADP